MMLGRTAPWGLGADGADGVARVFEIAREQMHIAKGFCGRTTIAAAAAMPIWVSTCRRVP